MCPAEDIKASLTESFLPVYSHAWYETTPDDGDYPMRRSSLYCDSLPGNGKIHDDGTRSVHRQLQSRLNQHEFRRRKSISVFPSSKHLYDNTGKSQHSSILALSTVKRQKDIDLDTLRLQRACGMSIDNTNMSEPFEPFQIDDSEAANRNGFRNDSSNIRNENRISSAHYENCSLTNSPGNETALSSAFCSSPASPALFSDIDGMIIHRPPPFFPLLDPYRQLASLEVLLTDQQHADGSSADPRPNAVESLIDIERLLQEHAVDGEPDEVDGIFMEQDLAASDTNDPAYRVFGQPLPLTRLYASCVSVVGGYQQVLPIVVHACVEELYRTGMTVPGLFRSAPNHSRHSQLIELFDTGPTYGRSVPLSKENTADICALLLTYIDRLPRAIWPETLFDAMLKLCVLPTVRYEKVIAEIAEDDEANGRTSGATNKAGARRPTSLIVLNTPPPRLGEVGRTRSSSLNDIAAFSDALSGALSFVSLSQISTARERPQLAAARLLFRLLPRAQLTLLVYLCGFFTQLPLSPHNQLTIDDIARLFAVPLFLGKPGDEFVSGTNENWNARKEQARAMMVWILRRWSYFSDGLFDADVDEELESGLTTSATSDDSENALSIRSCHSAPITYDYRTSGSSSSSISPRVLKFMPGGYPDDDPVEDRSATRDDIDALIHGSGITKCVDAFQFGDACPPV